MDDVYAQALWDRATRGDTKAWIIATDSEYVVKGMTEWLPTWEVSCTIEPLRQMLILTSRLVLRVEERMGNIPGHGAFQPRSLSAAIRHSYRDRKFSLDSCCILAYS